MGEKIGYARTSKKDENIETQLLKLIESGIEREKIFYDETVSGIVPAEQREGFGKLLEYTNENEVSGIYVFELSRIGRNFVETLQTIRKLEERNIMIMSVSPKESWLSVTDKSIRDLIMSIFSWVAERERENLVERTKAGIDRARKEGKQIGRPERNIDWKVFDKWYKKGIPIKSISKIMEIPYPTLYAKVKERKNNEKQRNDVNE